MARVGATEREAGSRVFGIIVLLALVAALLEALDGNLMVIIDDDEALFWSLRAKLLFLSGGFHGEYAEVLAQRGLPNTHYPILNPLLQLWTFDLAGRVTHVANRWPLQLLTIASIPILAASLRRTAGPWIAAVATIALVSCIKFTDTVRHAGSEGLVALGALVAWDAYLRWVGSGRRAWLGLCSLGMTTALWAKDEGLALVVVALLTWLVVRARRTHLRAVLGAGRTWFWLLPPVAALLAKEVHALVFPDPAAFALGPVLANVLEHGPGNLIPTLKMVTAAAVAWKVNAVPAIFVLLALATLPRWRRDPGGLAVPALGLFALIVLVLYLQTVPERLFSMIDNTVYRVMFQLLPLQLVWIGDRIASDVPSLRGARRGCS